MLDAQAVQAGQASTPPSTEIDMVIEETPLDQVCLLLFSSILECTPLVAPSSPHASQEHQSSPTQRPGLRICLQMMALGVGSRAVDLGVHQETIEECNVPLEIAATKTLLGQQQDSIEENGELITTAGAKIFELEPVINKIEEEFPIVKNKLRAYCKQTLDSFSDELDDMARADRDKWDCVHQSLMDLGSK
ncbi:hypothetical protein ACKLNR_003247 [Fusarium oxysporum f. sp. zingiberi]